MCDTQRMLFVSVGFVPSISGESFFFHVQIFGVLNALNSFGFLEPFICLFTCFDNNTLFSALNLTNSTKSIIHLRFIQQKYGKILNYFSAILYAGQCFEELILQLVEIKANFS